MIGMTLAGGVAPAAAQPDGIDIARIPRGEVRTDDLYTFADVVLIAGSLDGDLVTASRGIRVTGRITGNLIAAATRMTVAGQVDGDVVAAAETIDMHGTVGDTARVFANRANVSGTVGGDLMSWSNQLDVMEDATIAGDLRSSGSFVRVGGTVDGDMRATAGRIVIEGTVRGDANLTADRIILAPEAEILGDLRYSSRRPLRPGAADRVAGTITAIEDVDDTDAAGFAWWQILLWVWQTLAALLTGSVLVVLVGPVLNRTVAALGGRATIATLIGFAAFLIVPILAVVTLATLVGLPLGLAVGALYLGALYIAKIPVAVWLGDRLLTRVGRPGASRFATLAIGIVLLYALFAAPYVGWLIWLFATWLGLGAMVLAGRDILPVRGV